MPTTPGGSRSKPSKKPSIRARERGVIGDNREGYGQESAPRRELPAPRAPVPVTRTRRAPEPVCQFCGRAKGFSTPQLYLVHGGALGPRQRLLCALHAMAETSAGAVAVPYAEELGGHGVTQIVTPAVRRLAETVRSLSG
jgi:hypothetical protein